MTGKKIRADLEGVVYVPGGPVLKAGDEVPDGVEVGDHLVEKSSPRKSGEK